MSLPPELSGYRIAVVEDHPSVLRSLCGLLEACGAEVLTYQTGTELLADMPQVGRIVVDYHLSGADSLTLVSELRRIAADTSILIYTALSDRILEQRASDLGIKQIVDKSSDINDLLDAIRRHGN